MLIYDTMSRGKVEFQPLTEGAVHMYVCGPTVYDHMHVGHARSFVSFDFIARYLEYRGYHVSLVVNITDVEDKIINRAQELSISALELSSRFADEFIRSCSSLLLKPADVYPRASEHIAEILKMVMELVTDRFAYEIEGSVYFDITKAKDYGKLSGQALEQILAGARVDVDERKRHPADFALWKAAKPGEVSWDSPWGRGRPGWHIECSAMSMKYLGRTIDIHGGGEDLIFPHHENEIQQSEAFTGVTFSRYWMHGGMLNVTGEKMSKSLHNFMSVEEALKLHPPETLRLLFANSLYRRQMEFSPELLAESDKARERLEGYIQHLLSVQAQGDGGSEIASLIREDFVRAMDDDFNTRDAVASLFNNLREARKLADGALLSSAAAEAVIAAAREVNGVLRIIRETAFHKQSIGKDIEELISKREEARRQRRFDEADAIRRELSARGIILEDTESGVRWKRK